MIVVHLNCKVILVSLLSLSSFFLLLRGFILQAVLASFVLCHYMCKHYMVFLGVDDL